MMKRTVFTILACLCALFAQAQRDSTITVVIFDSNSEATGSLLVTSTPDHATVILDGKDVGKTPILLKELYVGKHDVIIKKRKYYHFMARAEVLQVQVGRIDVELLAKRNNKRAKKKSGGEMGATIVIGPNDPDGSFARMPDHRDTSSWAIVYEAGEVFDINNF